MVNRQCLFKQTTISIVAIWLFIFIFIPLMIMLILSFFQHNTQQLYNPVFTLANYQQLFSSLFLKILLHSLSVAFFVTLIVLVIAYPAAYIIAQCRPQNKTLLMLFMIIPFWTSSLIRTYGVMVLIKAKGLLNTLLISLGVIHQPLQILYSNTAIYIGMVYSLLPFMILPLFSSFERIDYDLIDAARDLGASRLRIMTHIIIPMTLSGIFAGVLFVFLPAMTLFYIPNILGGAKSAMLGNLIESQFLEMLNWPGGAATSVILTLLLFVLLAIYRWRIRRVNFQELL